MSALVYCGRKRSIFEEVPPPNYSTSIFKKQRRCSPLLLQHIPSVVVDDSATAGSVEFLVNEMKNATSLDDARARAARALQVLEQSVTSKVNAQAAEDSLKESTKLKEQIETLNHENTILKRGVAIQYERQKDYDSKNRELENLKHLFAQSQEQLRTLEVKNYALALHLKQAQQSSSIPGRVHPDVF